MSMHVMQDGVMIPKFQKVSFAQLSWLNGGVCGNLSAVGMHLFGGSGTLQ